MRSALGDAVAVVSVNRLFDQISPGCASLAAGEYDRTIRRRGSGCDMLILAHASKQCGGFAIFIFPWCLSRLRIGERFRV